MLDSGDSLSQIYKYTLIFLICVCVGGGGFISKNPLQIISSTNIVFVSVKKSNLMVMFHYVICRKIFGSGGQNQHSSLPSQVAKSVEGHFHLHCDSISTRQLELYLLHSESKKSRNCWCKSFVELLRDVNNHLLGVLNLSIRLDTGFKSLLNS